MTRPARPTLAPYVDQLPDHNAPQTWPTRTKAFWDWVTGPGYNNLARTVGYADAAMSHIDGALAGSDTVIGSVSELQARPVPVVRAVHHLSTSAAYSRAGSVNVEGAVSDAMSFVPVASDTRFLVHAASQVWTIGAAGGDDNRVNLVLKRYDDSDYQPLMSRLFGFANLTPASTTRQPIIYGSVDMLCDVSAIRRANGSVTLRMYLSNSYAGTEATVNRTNISVLEYRNA